MTIDHSDDRSVYLQAADAIRDDITSGRLKPGDELPSEGRLGHTLGIGREAVRQALGVLRHEGLIVTERGFGSRVRVPPPREARKLKRGDTVIARMPSEPERRSLRLDEGIPLVIVTHADGTVEQVAADTVKLTS